MSDQAELSPDLPIGRVPNEEVVDGAESGRSLTAGNTSMWGKVLGYLAPPRGSRFTSLDGYRALAALGVVVYHVAGKPLTSEDSVMGRFLFNLGNFGVAIFFLLSGFLLYRPFVMNWFNDKPSPDPIIYIRHRLLRIFPAYWAALTLFLVFVFKAQAKQGADFYVTLYSLTQTYRNSYGLAGISVAWTLSIEVSFYLALPFIAALIRLIGRGARTTKMKMEAQLIGVVILFVVSVGYRVLVAAPYQLDTKPDFSNDDSAKIRSTLDLIADPHPRAKGELVWRIGLMLSVVALAVLAIPLSFVNARSGRSANLLVALLVYFVYNNAMNVVQSWTSRGRIDFAVAWWLVHVVVIALAIAMLAWRNRVPQSLRSRMRAARAARAVQPA